MGWKGALRSMNAAANRAERSARRRQRELERQQKEYEKMLAFEQAQHDVEVYENYIDRLNTIHTECSKQLDWVNISKQKEPKEPVRNDRNERNSKHRLDTYKPSLFRRIFGNPEKIRSSLAEQVASAKAEDDRVYSAELRTFQEDHKAWMEETQLALDVIANEPKSCLSALKSYGAFSEIDELGTNLEITITDKNLVRVDLKIHSDEVIPKESKSLLQSGKLSIKKMSKGAFNEIFQDYVCSAILRVAREVFAVLPIEAVEVTALDELLNSSNGHLETQPIVSGLITRKTLEGLNLDSIDPSDSMSNFINNMEFKKTTGFKAVSKLNWEPN